VAECLRGIPVVLGHVAVIVVEFGVVALHQRLTGEHRVAMPLEAFHCKCIQKVHFLGNTSAIVLLGKVLAHGLHLHICKIVLLWDFVLDQLRNKT
jgi:hypothetical protein